MSKRLISIEDLPAKIVELLRATPRTSDELASTIGYSGSVLRDYLLDMYKDGCLDRKPHVGPNGGRSFLWSVVTGASRHREEEPCRPGSGRMYQKTVTKFNPYHFRDPLVSALFGRASKEVS